MCSLERGGGSIVKGLVLSGGFGTRLRPLTYSQQKQLIPVANKPILFYGIEDLIEAGVKDIGVIIGPNKNQVIDTVNSVSWDADIEFIEQEKPLGIAHAIKISREFLGNHPFIVYLGDNILKEGVVDHVNDFKNSDFEGSILLTEVKNPQDFGIATVNKKNEIVKLVEKPKDPPSSLAVIGVYLFRSKIFDAIEEIRPSKRNQLEITDAIQWLIDHHHKVKSSLVNNWWKDTGKPKDILEANHLVLDAVEKDIKGKIVNCDIEGSIAVGENSKISDTVLKGPCIIGKDVMIKNSYVGSYTSIGDDCKILSSEIEDSVIMNGTEIIDVDLRITDSLIGRNVKISKEDVLPTGNKFFLGDSSQVILKK